MIYAWSIKKEDSDSVLCAGVISATDSKRAEEIVRKDWGVTQGYFQYSIVRNKPVKGQNILLYKKGEKVK